MKNISLFLLISFLFLFSSCVDDFIESREIDYVETTDNYFKDEGEFYQGLVAAYDMLQATYINVLMGEIASDNTLCGGESATDVPGFQQVDDMTHTEVNAQLQDLWNWMFAGVYRCSYLLEFENNEVEFDSKAQMIAEARFLRAYYYFELVKWFGDLPLKETRFELGEEKSIPRSPVSEVYSFIENDLNLAISDLSETAPQIGRVTKGAAQALLGKVYLYQEKFSESATVLEQLINTGNYHLVENYEDIFEHSGENGPGSVFEVQYTDAEGASFDCLQCSSGNVAVGFNGIRNYGGPLFDSGYSFNVPVQEAYDAYEDGDTRKDIAILNIEAWSQQTGASYGTGYEHTGFFNRKYLPRQGDQNLGDQNLTNPNNYRSIRYADVLLMAAEALNRGSISDERARQYMNQVRQRAFGDSNHNINSGGSNLTSDIWNERRLELVGEGHRFFDLVRTGQAAQEIDGFVSGKHEVFPIPYEEIQLSDGNWQQNPNY